MKKYLFLILTSLSLLTVQAQYSPDILGDGFQALTIEMPDDYDGKVVTTLIRKFPDRPVDRAVLYIHGYNDYFFQTQMADTFCDSLFNFYAIDLRKYGRSMLPGQKPFQVRDLQEYFADIDTALSLVKKEGNREIILMGHSTGGLICALYCQAHRDRLPVQGLILNSPFLDMNQNWITENILIPVVSFFGRFIKNMEISQGKSTAYGESLLKGKHGEWEFDTTKKYLQSPPLTTAWIRAIHQGHLQIQKGLDIPCPILVMFSDHSVTGDTWTPEFQSGDAVLDVKDIEKYGKTLGPHVTEVSVKDGLHDLVLSRKDVREQVYRIIFDWLKANGLDR